MNQFGSSNPSPKDLKRAFWVQLIIYIIIAGTMVLNGLLFYWYGTKKVQSPSNPTYSITNYILTNSSSLNNTNTPSQ